MHIAQQTPEKLVIVSGSRWLSAVCAVGVLYTLYLVFVRHAPKGNLYVTAFLLLVALVMDLRKTFTFDAMQRVVRWKGRTVLKAEWGEIAFDDILDIGTDCSVAARNVPVYRLTIITSQGTNPNGLQLQRTTRRLCRTARADLGVREARVNETAGHGRDTRCGQVTAFLANGRWEMNPSALPEEHDALQREFPDLPR